LEEGDLHKVVELRNSLEDIVSALNLNKDKDKCDIEELVVELDLEQEEVDDFDPGHHAWVLFRVYELRADALVCEP